MVTEKDFSFASKSRSVHRVKLGQVLVGGKHYSIRYFCMVTQVHRCGFINYCMENKGGEARKFSE